MKQNDFDRLVASVKQAGAIRRGQLKPGRVTELQAEDVRAIRSKLAKSPEGICVDDWRECSHPTKLGTGTATPRRTGTRTTTGRSEESPSDCRSARLVNAANHRLHGTRPP